jgi:hypothetical protein
VKFSEITWKSAGFSTLFRVFLLWLQWVMTEKRSSVEILLGKRAVFSARID